MKRIITGVAVLAILFSFQPAFADNWTVSPNSDTDCSDNDCTLQNVLSLAAGNGVPDTITLAEGEYLNIPDGHKYFPGQLENQPLTIQGAGIGKTILLGDEPQAGQFSQILFIDTYVNTSLTNDSNVEITLSGITFRNGNTDQAGGAVKILVNDAMVSIDNCSFEGNSTTAGIPGGLLGGGGLSVETGDTGSISLTNSRFLNNSAEMGSGGGAVLFAPNMGQVTVVGNTFLDNVAGDMMGDQETAGGGLIAVSASGELFVNQNVFVGNVSDSLGGGFYGGTVFGEALISNNVFLKNTNLGAANSGGAPAGGAGMAILVVGGSVDIIHNTITENQDQGNGGGLLGFNIFNSATLSVANNIIYGNTAVGNNFCSPDPCNDIAFANIDGDGDDTGGTFNIFNNNYGDIYFGCQLPECTPTHNVDGNKTTNPLFVGAANHDFHLSSTSPVIDMGIAYDYSLIPTDLDGLSRVVGQGPDMGAYEWRAEALPAESRCQNRLDDDSDGSVDCEDPDCAGIDGCEPGGGNGEEICDNGIDDDGDFLPDCLDPNCILSGVCFDALPLEIEICQNEIDDDDNGFTDCDDLKCAFAPGCFSGEFPLPEPGECEAVADCLNFACWNSEVCREFIDIPIDLIDEICDNDIDDDGNGQTDCVDIKCVASDICRSGPLPLPTPGDACETVGDCLKPQCLETDICEGIEEVLPLLLSNAACSLNGSGGGSLIWWLVYFVPLMWTVRFRKK